MIQSKRDYRFYLEMDRVSSGIPPCNTLVAKLKELLFPNYIWRFIKALRRLEYCENVIRKDKSLIIRWGGGNILVVSEIQI